MEFTDKQLRSPGQRPLRSSGKGTMQAYREDSRQAGPPPELYLYLRTSSTPLCRDDYAEALPLSGELATSASAKALATALHELCRHLGLAT